MSYALELNDKAQRGLAALPPELQEEVLDELDRLAAHPDLLVFRGTSPDAIHDVVQQVGGSRFYVFITAQRDDAAGVVWASSIGHAVLPADPG